MIIRNKFNGYGFDGARTYNDPATLAALASATTTTTAVTAPTLAATTATALPTVVASTAPTATAAFTGQAVTPALTSAGGAGAGAGGGAGLTAGGAGTAGTATTTAGGAGGGGGIMSGGGTPTLGGASPGISGPSTGMLESSLNAVDPSVAQFAEAQNMAAQNLAAQGSNIQGGAAQRLVQGPVDMTNAGFSQNFTAAADASKGLTSGGVDPNILGQSGGATPGGINVTPEMSSKFATDATTAGKSVGDYFMKGMQYAEKHPIITSAGLYALQGATAPGLPKKKKYEERDMSGFERSEPSAGIYNPVYQTSSNYAVGGPVEQMSAENAVGQNMSYPQAGYQTPMYANPMVQRPMAQNVIAPASDVGIDPYTGEQRMAEGGVSGSMKYLKELEAEQKRQQEEAEEAMNRARRTDVGVVSRSRTQQLNSPYSAAAQELAALYKKRGIKFTPPPKTSVDVMGDSLDEVPYAAGGGIMTGLGGYSDGGRLLKGPGDGVSDSIPAVIGKRQPARLADGEFVVPARIVSELGNGSTEAGARKLYAMMERVQKARGKTVGKKKVAVNSKADKHLPA